MKCSVEVDGMIGFILEEQRHSFISCNICGFRVALSRCILNPVVHLAEANLD